jgi:hypothetical protein
MHNNITQADARNSEMAARKLRRAEADTYLERPCGEIEADAEHAIEFRTETQDWTQVAPRSRYTGTREEMQELLSGQLARPPFTIPGTEYRMVAVAR